MSEFLNNIKFNKLLTDIIRISDIKDLDNRPEVDNYVLCDQYHYWLVENNIEYSLKWIKQSSISNNISNWFIVFYRNQDAILFKLTWS
jgi:hypothetical protein